MTLDIAAITGLCVPMSMEPHFSFVFTPQISAAVLNPAGDNRIVGASDAGGGPVSQLKFSNTVAKLWRVADLFAPSERTILSLRTLNPRASISDGQIMSALGGIDGSALARLEHKANESLQIGLKYLSIMIEFETVKPPSKRQHFYFIPPPADPTAGFVDSRGKVLPVQSLKDCIISYLLLKGRITQMQAIAALNAYVSVFPLTAEELSRLLHTDLTQDSLDTSLMIFASVMMREGFRSALPEISVSEHVAAMSAAGIIPDTEEEAPTIAEHIALLSSLGVFGDSETVSGEGSVSGMAELSEAKDGEDANFMRVYQTQIRGLALAKRLEMAKSDDPNTLCALCYDQDPQVIIALVRNPHSALKQAQLVAAHHHTSQGLEALFRSHGYVKDPSVRRFLLHNIALQEGQAKRLFETYTLPDLYKMLGGHEAVAHFKGIAREVFKVNFGRASADEKVRLIMTTHGRCLNYLSRQPLGAATVAALMRQQVFSEELFHRLERYPGVTPKLVTHMQAKLRRESA